MDTPSFQKFGEFAGLSINNYGIKPAKAILAAIIGFPIPVDLTQATVSWAYSRFALCGTMRWCGSISPIMEPFRDLINCECVVCQVMFEG